MCRSSGDDATLHQTLQSASEKFKTTRGSFWKLNFSPKEETFKCSSRRFHWSHVLLFLPIRGPKSALYQRQQIISCILKNRGHGWRAVFLVCLCSCQKTLRCGWWLWHVHNHNLLAGSSDAERSHPVPALSTHIFTRQHVRTHELHWGQADALQNRYF